MSMGLDAIIISDIGEGSFSSTNPLKLRLDGRLADVQVIRDFVGNGGKLAEPLEEKVMNWASATRLNGIHLHHHLAKRAPYRTHKQLFE